MKYKKANIWDWEFVFHHDDATNFPSSVCGLEEYLRDPEDPYKVIDETRSLFASQVFHKKCS